MAKIADILQMLTGKNWLLWVAIIHVILFYLFTTVHRYVKFSLSHKLPYNFTFIEEENNLKCLFCHFAIELIFESEFLIYFTISLELY